MSEINMVKEYYDWIARLIHLNDREYRLYSKTIEIMFNTEFKWHIDMDSNRAMDGLDLRLRFSSIVGCRDDFWHGYLPSCCSVLEMIVALCVRMEDDIMYDPEYGDRIYFWFWDMFFNLGLTEMNNGTVDLEKKVGGILDVFMSRKYGKDGKGSLFRFRRPSFDVRNTEIWYQMNHYIEENFE